MEEIIKSFCSVSGQKVNLAKSELFFSHNMSSNMKDELSAMVGIPRTNYLGIYLVMPLPHKSMSKDTYGFLIDKFQKKLSPWKGCNMSMVPRALLIQIS